MLHESLRGKVSFDPRLIIGFNVKIIPSSKIPFKL
jgi:hypothetical protein